MTIFLLLGVPGVGKSTVIDELLRRDVCDFLTTYTTRPARANDRKTAISEEQFKLLQETGEIILANELYGFNYGLSAGAVSSALCGGRPAVIDWSVDDVEALRQHVKGDVRTIYLYPRDWREAVGRLRNRDGIASRAREEVIRREIQEVDRGVWSKAIDTQVTVHHHKVESVVRSVTAIMTV